MCPPNIFGEVVKVYGGGTDGKRKGGKGGDVPIEDLASLFRTDVPGHPLESPSRWKK